MADINAIATQFAEFYYKSFADTRPSLVSLYRDTSMLTWEGSQFLGSTSILEKLTALPFTKVQHRIVTLDAQPLPITGGMSILITGELLVDDSEHPIKFSQIFNLLQESGSYYVFNDVFRLNYG